MFKAYRKIANTLDIFKTQQKRIEYESAIYQKNRAQVLLHYRYLLKALPKFYQRKLQQRSIYLELCHLFHDSKVLSSFEETTDRINHLRQFVKSIEAGDRTVIGNFLPARSGEYITVKALFTQHLKKRRVQ